jgi:hypothetical protein
MFGFGLFGFLLSLGSFGLLQGLGSGCVVPCRLPLLLLLAIRFPIEPPCLFSNALREGSDVLLPGFSACQYNLVWRVLFYDGSPPGENNGKR